MKRKHRDSKAIDALGGTVAVARMFGIRPQAISQWRNKGIPDARRMYLEVVRPDVLSAIPQAKPVAA